MDKIKIPSDSETADPEQQVIQTTKNYITESTQAKTGRMQLNRDNFDCYHLMQDYSHKTAGQSKEFLSKQSMAVEQITAFFQQGLVDIGDWFSVELSPGMTPED